MKRMTKNSGKTSKNHAVPNAIVIERTTTRDEFALNDSRKSSIDVAIMQRMIADSPRNLNVTGNIIQRRVLISFDGGDVVTNISITGSRPGWWAIAKERHPAQTGYDRRHIIAWALIKRDIEDNIRGKNLAGITDYLLDKNNFVDSDWAKSDVIPNIIEKLATSRLQDVIEYYASARFNDPLNLWIGVSHPNRALGVRIRSSYAQMLETFEEWDPSIPLNSQLPKPYALEYPFMDERTRKVESKFIPVNTYRDVVEWYANMALDWKEYTDWQEATPWFLRHIRHINPELADMMEERVGR